MPENKHSVTVLENGRQTVERWSFKTNSNVAIVTIKRKYRTHSETYKVERINGKWYAARTRKMFRGGIVNGK